MSQQSFQIPENYKIIKVSVDRVHLGTIYNDPKINESNEVTLNYLTKDYQGKAQFFDIDFNNGQAMISWGVQRGSKEAEDHNKQGFAAAKEKNFEKAIEHWRKAAYLNRNDPDTLYNLALAYFEVSNYTKALDKSLEVVESCPVYFRAHFLLGSIYSKLRKFDQAADYLRRGLLFQPENVTVLVNLGAITSILKRIDEAIQHFERAISLAPNNSKAFLGLGKLYAGQSDLENANRCFKAVIKLDPNGKLGQIAKNSIIAENSENAMASNFSSVDNNSPKETIQDVDELYSQAYKSYIKCDYANACKLFERYVQEKVRDYRAWSILAICQVRTGQKQQALRSIEKALSYQSKNSALLKQASILYDACGDPDRAAETALQAHSMGKNDSVTLTLVGIGKAHQGELQDGARLLYDAINKNPNNLKARFSLASVLHDLGQNDSAKQQLEEILWTDYQTPLKDKARNLLSKLG
jgi:tetratricopeptide (TPR) repeat protein